MKTAQPHADMHWIRQEWYSGLSKLLWIFVFDIIPKLSTWEFLKGQLQCETWNYSKTVSYSVPLKTMGLSRALSRSFTHAQSCSSVHLSFGKYYCIKYANLLKVDIFVINIKKITWLMPPISSEKSLSIRKLSSSQWQIQVFQKSILLLFSLKWQARFVYFWESVCHIYK